MSYSFSSISLSLEILQNVPLANANVEAFPKVILSDTSPQSRYLTISEVMLAVLHKSIEGGRLKP